MMKDKPRTEIRASSSSLSKALQLLVAVSESGPDGLTVSVAAKMTGHHTATAHRLMTALIQKNFLSFDPCSKFYHLGLMPYELVTNGGQQLESMALRNQLRSSLTFIQSKVGGIACLSVISGNEALCIDLIAGQSEITVNTL